MEIKTLKQLASFIRTGKTPSTKQTEYFDGVINWYGPPDLGSQKLLGKSKRTLSQLAFDDKKAVVFPSGTLLVGCIGDIGKLGVTTNICSSNQQLTGVYPNKDTDVNYLYYWFRANKKTLESISNNAVVPILNNRTLETLEIPLPPLDVQQKIASILDAADTLRQKDKALLAKYDELTQALFLDMFGDPVSNPKGWEKVELRKLCSFKKKNVKPEDILTDTKYVALDSIQKGTGKIVTIYDTEFGGIKSNKFWFDETYILYGKLRPYLNKVALPDFQGVCSTDIIPIQPIQNKSNRNYISSILKHQSFVSFANERCSGANLPRISPSEVEKYLTISAPLELQTQFAERVAIIEQQKTQAQASLEKSEELFNSLLQKAFKGELVEP